VDRIRPLRFARDQLPMLLVQGSKPVWYLDRLSGVESIRMFIVLPLEPHGCASLYNPELVALGECSHELLVLVGSHVP
jgi:hypothetical protein